MSSEEVLLGARGRRVGRRAQVMSALAYGAAQGLGALAFLVLARRSSVEQFGAFSSLYGIGLLAAVIIDFGSTQYRLRELAQSSDLLRLLLWLRRRLVPSLLCSVLLGVWSVITFATSLGFMSAALLSLLPLTFLLSSVTTGVANVVSGPTAPAVQFLLGNVAFLVCTLFVNQQSLAMASFGATGSWLVTATAGRIFLAPVMKSVRSDSVKRKSKQEIRVWRGSFGFGLSSISSSSPYLDVPLLAAVSGLSAAGSYGAVYRWGAPIGVLGSLAAAAVFPEYVRATSDVQALRIMKQTALLLSAALGASIFLLLYAEPLVVALLGKGYEDAVTPLRLTALASVGQLVTASLNPYLQARGAESRTGVILATSTLIRLALLIGLGYAFGATGGALAAVVGLWLGSLLLARELWRRLRR